MTPTSSSSELIELRVQRERAWCYARWLERRGFTQIRQLANLPESEGGLGYDLSESAVKALVLQAREAAGDLSMGKDERRERQAHEVDERARAARNDMAQAYRRADALDAAIASWHSDDYESMADARSALARLVAQREGVDAAIERADRRLDLAATKEARLFGLDAPTEAKVDVTTHDGVTAELNAMLARAGRKPVEVTE